MLWHIELKFYIWLCLTVLQIKFECRQFASIFVGVMPLSGLTGNTQLYTCIDKFSWNLKFHVGFFNAFLLCFRKVLYKNSPLKCSRRAYYAPFVVLMYIWNFWRDYFHNELRSVSVATWHCREIKVELETGFTNTSMSDKSSNCLCSGPCKLHYDIWK